MERLKSSKIEVNVGGRFKGFYVCSACFSERAEALPNLGMAKKCLNWLSFKLFLVLFNACFKKFGG